MARLNPTNARLRDGMHLQTFRYGDIAALRAAHFLGPEEPMSDIRKARDKAVYTRQQKGHSLTKHLLLGWVVLYIPTIYYAVSPNHYFHA
jgi:hypothetical protein